MSDRKLAFVTRFTRKDDSIESGFRPTETIKVGFYGDDTPHPLFIQPSGNVSTAGAWDIQSLAADLIPDAVNAVMKIAI